MIRRLVVAVGLGFAISLSATPLDDRPLLGLANRFRLAWNQHDMAAMAQLFTEDADFVNVGGRHWKGRRQIREVHAKLHEMQFKESVLTFESVKVRFLKPDVALVHIEWRLEGDRDADGTSRAPRTGVVSWVVVRQRDEWWIASSHNTNVRETPPGS